MDSGKVHVQIQFVKENPTKIRKHKIHKIENIKYIIYIEEIKEKFHHRSNNLDLMITL